MIVQNLLINGFKSFDTKRSIDLDFPLTAFIGPNGSGKSNISDAIRWVLGEQSIKKLRATKQEDLIFAGSSKKVRKGMAEACLTMDNSQNFFDLPYQQVAITRRIFRDGQSQYLINNNKILLRELHEIMAKSGLGSYDLMVIGQGEIDQILIMGSEQIQSLLEDASGVKPFYIKKHRTSRYVARTIENTVRLQDILGELEPRLKELRRESKHAQAFIQIKQELKQLQHKWFVGQNQRIDTDLKKVQQKEQQNKKDKAQMHAFIKEREDKIATISSELSQRQGALRDKQNCVEKLQSNQSALWQELAGIDAKLEFNESLIKNISIKKDAKKNKELITQQSDLNKKIAQIEIQIEQAHEKEQELRDQIDKSISKHQKALDELNKLTASQAQKSDTQNLKKKMQSLLGLYKKLATKLFGSTKPKLQELQRLLNEGRHVHEQIEPLLQDIETALADEPMQESEEIIQSRKLADTLADNNRKIQIQLSQLISKTNQLSDSKRKLQRENQQINSQLMKLGGDESETDKKQRLQALHKEQQYLLGEQARIQKDINTIKHQIDQQKQQIKELFSQQKENKQLDQLKKEVYQKRGEITRLNSEEQELLIQRTRLETKKENIYERARQEFNLSSSHLSSAQKEQQAPPDKGTVCPEGRDLGGLSFEQLAKLEDEMLRLKARLERIGDVNQKAPAEYEEIKTRYEWLYDHIQSIETTIKFIESQTRKVDKYIDDLFDHVFSQTQQKFGEYFQILFGGGEGKLICTKNTLLDQKEIHIKARPPKKKMHDLNLLSGGERSLGAVALLFAILESCQTPFCVLDEVDAALDEANIGRFCQALKRLNGNTQVILVTHNKRTMEAADCLYGTTMQDDATSQIVSLKLEDYAEQKAG